jgi:hypothetical protein
MEAFKIAIIGFGGILFGFIMIWYTNRTRKNDMFLSTSLKGYSAGILAIFFGILYMLREFNIIHW